MQLAELDVTRIAVEQSYLEKGTPEYEALGFLLEMKHLEAEGFIEEVPVGDSYGLIAAT